MREILFRGKCQYTNEWVEGFYYQAKLCRTDKDLCHYITIPHPECDGRPSDHIMVDPSTVGQYTGLTDKNGTKIFEGDIIILHGSDLPYWFDEGQTAVVEYDDDGFTPLCEYDSDCGGLVLARECEVIGNIHDNPELLEASDNVE